MGRLGASKDSGRPGTLVAATLDRARDYGLLEEAPTGARRDPLDPAWRAVLGSALGELASDPIAASWLGRD